MTATTFSIVVVFVPIAFMGGIAEQWFAPFALTIACSVLVSLFVSFSLDPMLSAYWPDPAVPLESGSFFVAHARPFQYVVRPPGRSLQDVSSPGRWTTGWRWWASPVVSFAGALALPALGFRRRCLLAGDGRVEVHIDFRDAAGIEPRLHPGEGRRGGPHRAEAAGSASTPTPAFGGAFGRRGQGRLRQALIRRPSAPKAGRPWSATSGLTCRRWPASPRRSAPGSADEKQIQLQVRGPDSRELTKVAEQVAGELRATCRARSTWACPPRARSRSSTSRSIARLAGSLGVTVGQVAQALRPAFAGIDVGDWIDPSGRDARRDGAPRAGVAHRASADLESLPITVHGRRRPGVDCAAGPGGAHRSAIGPARIDHLDRDRVITVEANTEDRPAVEVDRRGVRRA